MKTEEKIRSACIGAFFPDGLLDGWPSSDTVRVNKVDKFTFEARIDFVHSDFWGICFDQLKFISDAVGTTKINVGDVEYYNSGSSISAQLFYLTLVLK